MKCLRLFMMFDSKKWMSAILVSILVQTVHSLQSSPSSSSSSLPSSSPRYPHNAPRPPRRLFSNAGLHEVEAPKLGRPGATPPPPPVVRVYQPEIPSNGFKPILSTRSPVGRRRRPQPLDYGTDIITIYDLEKDKKKVKLNNDTFLRTVSSSLQVDNPNPTNSRGRVYDDVIYDIIPDSRQPATDNIKPSETVVDVRHLPSTGSRSGLESYGWRKLPVTYRLR